jgi:hypothetical protein
MEMAAIYICVVDVVKNMLRWWQGVRGKGKNNCSDNSVPTISSSIHSVQVFDDQHKQLNWSESKHTLKLIKVHRPLLLLLLFVIYSSSSVMETLT